MREVLMNQYTAKVRLARPLDYCVMTQAGPHDEHRFYNAALAIAWGYELEQKGELDCLWWADAVIAGDDDE